MLLAVSELLAISFIALGSVLVSLVLTISCSTVLFMSGSSVTSLTAVTPCSVVTPTSGSSDFSELISLDASDSMLLAVSELLATSLGVLGSALVPLVLIISCSTVLFMSGSSVTSLTAVTPCSVVTPVSYTHLTLPTNREV